MTNNTDRLIVGMYLNEFTKNHNIHLMAITPILSFLKQLKDYDNLEDVQGGLNTVLYDMQCLDAVLHDNSDTLWKIKDYRDSHTPTA